MNLFSKIEGGRELGENLRRLGREVSLRIASQATAAAAVPVKRRAKANVIASPSVQTGSLRDALITKKLSKSETAKAGLTSAHIVTVRGRGKPRGNVKRKQARAPHAHFVEFGTIHMPAEPFLGPAITSEKTAALDAMVGKIRTGIAKAAGK